MRAIQKFPKNANIKKNAHIYIYIYICCICKKALYSRGAENFLPAIKKQKKWETCGGSIFMGKNEQNHGPRHGPRHGPKSEDFTFGLVAPSVFIQIGENNAGNYFLVCRFQIF